MRAALVGLLLASACAKGAPDVPDAAAGSIVVHGEHAALRQGGVGAKLQEDATYVLVDVENKSPDDRQVVLGGTLVDGKGADLGPLSPDALRIPAHGTRTFALVSTTPFPDAASARFQVLRAPAQPKPDSIVVAQVKTHLDGVYLDANATLRNDGPHAAQVVVIASYHHGDTIIARPFTVVTIPGQGRTLDVHFDGYSDSDRVDVYPGEENF